MLTHKRSVDKLSHTTMAAERATMALEGIQSSLWEITQSVILHPPVPSCPAIIPHPPVHPMHDLPVCTPVHPLQATSSSSSDCQSARHPEYHPTKWGHPAADNMEDVEASTEVDEGPAKEMEIS